MASILNLRYAASASSDPHYDKKAEQPDALFHRHMMDPVRPPLSRAHGAHFVNMACLVRPVQAAIQKGAHPEGEALLHSRDVNVP